jgi:hypothetical protein
MDKQRNKDQQEKILDLVRSFCSKKLDEDYSDLAERLTLKLGRKRTNLLSTGKPEVWAAGIIHALGTINFLFDKSFEPFVSVDEINEHFGTNKSTTGNKSKQIREMFKMNHFNDEFSTRKMKDDSPFNNLVMVDGLIVPLDTSPEQYQDMVRQARAEGKDISFSTN